MTQVGYGIGDISTAEKRKLAVGNGVTPPRWPVSGWGRVAAAAWHGRCAVFTDFLAPALRDCAESVTYLTEADAIDSASRLSDIAFQTCLADREGPVDLVAHGLAALWFERDLARLAGTLPRDLESSETALAAVVRRRTDRRAEANAGSVVVRVLLEAGTLHARCVREARRSVSAWQDLVAADAARPDAETRGHDLQRLSDAASHLGLAAARYGDRVAAANAWQLSRRIAEQDLSHDVSRIARADTNLAALTAETGHGPDPASAISEVFGTRLTLAARQPDNAAAWRRLTVTARARADIARARGQVGDGVRLAAELLADRQARLGDQAHADIAEARVVLGQALLAAGHPVAARRHLEEAADTRHARFLATSYRVQEDLLWLARAALVLEQPQTVQNLLAGQAAATDWFCDQVSFRLGYTARRLLALAILARLADAEAQAGLPRPARGWTLVLLGRTADQLGDAARAAEYFGLVTELGAGGIDPGHPVILTARYDEAVRRAATGDTREAADLLEPVLDRTVLAHGYAALGDAHPLLARARTLAGRLGITWPDSRAAIDEASLDIDV